MFLNVFAPDSNLRKNVFQIDMPPYFLLWRIKREMHRDPLQASI